MTATQEAPAFRVHLAEMERRRDEQQRHQAELLASTPDDVLLGMLSFARASLAAGVDDAYARQNWELSISTLRREIAIRNVRATARLGEGGLSEPHIDALEKFVDRMHDRHPETCEAIAAALALIARLVPKEDDRG